MDMNDGSRTVDERLSKEEHEQIFRDILDDADLDRFSSQENPKAIIIAGQPGAGKSTLTQAAEKELKYNCVVVDPDELRARHPKAQEYLKENPKTWAGRVHEDASGWAKALQSEAINRRQNLLVDRTLSNSQDAKALMEELKAKGYEIEVQALAVKQEQSLQGINVRYENAMEKYIDTGNTDTERLRWVGKDVHDKAYDGMPKSIEIIEKKGLADEIKVYGRKNEGVELLYSSNNRLARQPNSARDAIEMERNRPMSPDERVIFEERWKGIKQQRIDRGASAEELKEVDRMMKLNRIEEKRIDTPNKSL